MSDWLKCWVMKVLAEVENDHYGRIMVDLVFRRRFGNDGTEGLVVTPDLTRYIGKLPPVITNICMYCINIFLRYQVQTFDIPLSLSEDGALHKRETNYLQPYIFNGWVAIEILQCTVCFMTSRHGKRKPKFFIYTWNTVSSMNKYAVLITLH